MIRTKAGRPGSTRTGNTASKRPRLARRAYIAISACRSAKALDLVSGTDASELLSPRPALAKENYPVIPSTRDNRVI